MDRQPLQQRVPRRARYCAVGTAEMTRRRGGPNAGCPARPLRMCFPVILALLLGGWLAGSIGNASAAEPSEPTPLRIAVYDVPPYGYLNPDGSMSGISVDLWRRVAEKLERQFKLIAVSAM